MIDLRELMDERSAGHGEVPAAGRLEAVRRKIALSRRRRTAAGAAVAVATAIVAAVPVTYLAAHRGEAGVTSPGNGSTAAPPSVPATANPKPAAGRRIGPFAEYADGYRVVAIGQAPVSERTVRFSWKVGETDTQFFTYCPGLPGHNVSLDGEFAIDGVPATAMNCISELHQDADSMREPVSADAGDTVTVTYTVTGGQDMAHGGRELKTVPTEGTIYVAVAEKVPFADYPLPPRPAALQPPRTDGMATEPGTKVVHSDPRDPNSPVTTTLTWHQGYDFTVVPQTPGIYSVAVNGVTVVAGEVFDYAGNGPNIGCSVRPGERTCAAGLQSIKDGTAVTVAMTAQYATGPWLVEMRSHQTNPSAHG